MCACVCCAFLSAFFAPIFFCFFDTALTASFFTVIFLSNATKNQPGYCLVWLKIGLPIAGNQNKWKKNSNDVREVEANNHPTTTTTPSHFFQSQGKSAQSCQTTTSIYCLRTFGAVFLYAASATALLSSSFREHRAKAEERPLPHHHLLHWLFISLIL